jgi:hypothetical protein
MVSSVWARRTSLLNGLTDGVAASAVVANFAQEVSVFLHDLDRSLHEEQVIVGDFSAGR